MASVPVHVALLSGRSASILASNETTLAELMLQAQRVLQTGTGIFLAASGEVLCLEHTLAQAGVQAGDVLTLQVRQTRVAASSGSFTALLADGSVVSWGENPCCEKLVNVQQIQATQTLSSR